MQSYLKAALVVLLLIGLSIPAMGRNLHFNDGSILECQSLRKDGEEVVARVNRDVVLRFSSEEVNMLKTFPPVKRAAVRHRAAQKPEPDTPEVKEVKSPPPATVKTGPAAAASPSASPLPAKSGAAKPERPAPAAPVAFPAPPPVHLPENLPPPVSMERVGALAMGSAVVYLVSVLVLLIILIVANYRIFEKAGEPGWKSLIPIYNLYILIRISGKPGWWFLLLFIPVVGVVILLLSMIALAARFGKGALFGVGLFLLNFIFFPLLAFDGSTYEPAVS